MNVGSREWGVTDTPVASCDSFLAVTIWGAALVLVWIMEKKKKRKTCNCWPESEFILDRFKNLFFFNLSMFNVILHFERVILAYLLYSWVAGLYKS